MSSSKSERTSRRSSILKPPKPRQPLQSVEVNVPSPENSPAASAPKVRRRVSFAEKKHVKEFCDSMEQGTVWDNTYEESELSQRHSQNSNSDENICTVEFSNHHSQIKIVSTTNYESITCESISTSIKSRYSSTALEDPRILACDPNIPDSVFEMVEGQSTRIPFPANHVESFKARQSATGSMISTDPNLTERKQLFSCAADIPCSAIIDSDNPETVCQDSPNEVAAEFAGKDSNECVPMEETMIGDLSLDMPPTKSIIHMGVEGGNLENNSMPQVKFAIFQDNSMEMSEKASNPLEVRHSTTLTRMESKEESLLAAKEQTMGMKTMELTNALSKITEPSKCSLNNLNLRPERSLFHDRSIDCFEGKKMNRSVQKAPEPPPEKEATFHNESGKFNDLISNISLRKSQISSPTKTQIFENLPVDFTEIVQQMPRMDLSEEPLESCESIVQNESIDFTEAVAHVPIGNKRSLSLIDAAQNFFMSHVAQKSSAERTTIFQNESIDFTEVVPHLTLHGNKPLSFQNLSRTNLIPKSSPERTTIFQNESIDFTEAVPHMSIFNDKSLSSTEAIQNLSRMNIAPKSPPERTTIFHNKSVDFTEAIQNIPNMERSQMQPSEDATLRQNKSVDFADAVERVSSQILPTELTPIINKKSLVVELFSKDIQKSLTSIPEPIRATMNREHSENCVQDDINAVQSNLAGSIKESEINERNVSQNERFSEFCGAIADNSGIARSISKEIGYSFEKNTANDTRGNIPRSQDLLDKDFDPELQSPLRKRSKSFENKLIDVTAALPGSRFRWTRMQQCEGVTDKNPKGINEDIAASNLQDQSMEMTVALGCLPQLAREESQYSESFDNENSNRLQLLPSIFQAVENRGDEKPFIATFQDQSMEMTAAVSHVPMIGIISIPNKTSITEHGEEEKMVLHDDSMDVTGVVKSSSDVPENIHSNQKSEHRKSQLGFMKMNSDRKTIVAHDDSLELTGPVQSVPPSKTPFLDKENCPNSAADRYTSGAKPNNEERTIVFRDDGMELTRAVQLVPPSNTLFLDKENCPIVLVDRYTCGGKPINERRTIVFRNDGMELTGAVQSALPNNAPSLDKENCPISADRYISRAKPDNEGHTIVFRNDEMELTGALQLAPSRGTFYLDKENLPISTANRCMFDTRALEDDQNNDPRSIHESTEKHSPISLPSLQSNKENVLDPGDLEKQSQMANCGSDDITGVVAFTSQCEEKDCDESLIQFSGRDKKTSVLQNAEVEIIGTMLMPLSSNSNEGNCRNSSSDPQQMEQIDAFPIAEKVPRRFSQVAKGLFQNTGFSPEYREEKQSPIVMREKTGTENLEAELRRLNKSDVLEEETGFDEETFLRQQAQCMEDYEANSTASQNYETAAQLMRTEGLARSNRESLTIVDWKMNASAENDDASFVDNRCFPSKSLEELKNCAYAANEFRPDETGYENTAAISIVPDGKFYETIMLEDLQAMEPPSFALKDSAAWNDESETNRKKIDSVDHREDELALRTTKDTSNSSVVELPEITEMVNVDRIVHDPNNENIVERMERKRMPSSKMYKMEKITTDKPVMNASLSDTNDDAITNYRRSSTGLTTAAEFSSETPNSPYEKLRRRENFVPVEDNENLLTASVKSDRYGSAKNCASSTVIDDDVMRKLMHRGVEETDIAAEHSVFDEFASDVDKQEKLKNINESAQTKEAINDNDMSAEISVHENPFDVMKQTIEKLAKRIETIWTINRLDESIVAFNFFSNSIVLAIYLSENKDTSIYPIETIEFLSQLDEDYTDPGVCLAHRLIMQNVDSLSLNRSYRTFDDIVRMLEVVSMEVKLGMDFMFDLDRLRNQNIIEFDGNRITFMIRTTNINAGIILNITVDIKSFAEINSNDISVSYLLGKEKVRENDIKKLITNVKRDHRFLRYYMNDVKDYIDLMAETGFSSTSKIGCR